MREYGLMALAFAAVIQTAGAVDGTHINGRAISAQWRAGGLNWGAACCDCDASFAGSIDLFTIQSGAVTKTDTLYKRELGYAFNPAFNMEATKVAFYRANKGPGSSGTSCAAVNGGKNTISMINIDGTGLMNICDLPTDIPRESGLDWPAGEWIYYVYPNAVRYSTDPKPMTDNNEIWKVNYRTHENVKVCKFQSQGKDEPNCTFFRRFSLNLTATYMGVQGIQKYNCTDPSWFCNNSVPFPGNCNINAGGGGCNLAISASGNYAVRWNGDHTLNIFDKNSWAPAGIPNPPGQLYIRDFAINGSVGADAEVMRWAVNSDKWFLDQVGWYGHASGIFQGSEQVALNWVEKVGIRISNNGKKPLDTNPAGGGVIYTGNEPGDLWIDGGAAAVGKYEDASGNWQPVPGYVPTENAYVPVLCSTSRQLSVSADGLGNVRIDLPRPDRATVRIVDTKGRAVVSGPASNGMTLLAGTLKPGIYIAEVTQRADKAQATITITR